jgi:hypothetical protein
VKYLLIALLFVGCTKGPSQTDKDLEELNRQIEETNKQFRVIDCEMGVLYAIDAFHKQLYKKITKEEYEIPWAKCKELVK